MAEHTPTPWHVAYLDNNAQRVVKAEHIEIATCWHHSVGSIEKEMEANAALIVRAVNSHEALVKALRACRDELQLVKDGSTGGIPNAIMALIPERVMEADAALALCEQEGGGRGV